MAQEKVQTSQGLTELTQETEAEIEKLTEEIEQEPKAIPGGSPRKAKRRGLKKLLHKLRKDYVPRMKKYEEAEEIFAGRNSYSKTDHDATFMHMKVASYEEWSAEARLQYSSRYNESICSRLCLVP